MQCSRHRSERDLGHRNNHRSNAGGGRIGLARRYDMKGASPILWRRVEARTVDRTARAFFHAPRDRSGRSGDLGRKGLCRIP
jgi:hypothetical protein